LNVTLDKHRFIYNSIFSINHTLNLLNSHNINIVDAKDTLISAATADRVKLELQLPHPLLR
jgi:hypothetical protein